MRQIPSIVVLLLSILCFAQGVSAQSRLAEDNKRLAALARPFNSYSIRLLVNDSVSHSQLAEINKELRKHFSFLRSKRYKQGNAACEVQVSVRGKVEGDLDYASSFKNSTYSRNVYYTHTYLLSHISSADLSLHSKGAELARIRIDSNALIERRYSFTEVKGDYSWMNDPAMASLQAAKDVQSAMNEHNKAREIWTFEKDFFELLKKYVSR